MNPSKKEYLITVTHEDFKWPRKVPLVEIPSQPSRRPGIRIFHPDPESSVCKQALNAIQEIKPPTKRVKKIEKHREDVLMSREKFINKNFVSKHRKDRFTSTYQIDFVKNVLPYENLIDQVHKTTDQTNKRRKCKNSTFKRSFIMPNFIEKFFAFIRYWYFRYTLVTELYMVEKWERNFIHVFLISVFCLLFYFNYKVLLPMTNSIFIES